MDVSYILVFIILLTGVLIWQVRTARSNIYTLSEQFFPDLILRVLIEKKDRKIQQVIVRVKANKDLDISQIKCEVISEKREFDQFEIKETGSNITFPILLKEGEEHDFSFLFERLKETLLERAPDKFTFRMIAESGNYKAFKSHELALSKYWKIYRADSGNYN